MVIEGIVSPDILESLLMSVIFLRDKSTHYFKSGYGRLYSPVTSLKRELRERLSFRGSPLVELDIVASQPLFLGKAIIDSINDNKNNGNISSTLKNKIYTPSPSTTFMMSQVLDKPAFDPMFTGVSALSRNVENGFEKETEKETEKTGYLPQDIIDYLALIQSGNFYERIGEWAGLTDRDAIKDELFGVYYGGSKRMQTAVWKAILDHFPSVAVWIRNFKKGNHARLAWAMQRAESKMVIETICSRIREERPACFILTVHDSLSCAPEDVEWVQAVMAEEFAKVGLYPKIRIKHPKHPKVAK